MFKVGDKVKVVKGHCYPDSRKVYEVAYYGPGDYEATKAYTYVGLVEEEGRWSPDRFELVKPESQAAPKFKTGDLVRCLHSSDGRILPDVVYTIADTVEHRVYLKGFAGAYHQDIFQIAEPGLTKSQSAGIAGGLQEHSVGEYYPLTAVMYEHNGKRIITIENLQTGEVNAINGEAINWETFEDAYKRMESKPFTNWTKGRVSYVHGRWVVAEPVNPVRVTRLRNMLHRG